MAVFDRLEHEKVNLDDTHQLLCEIEAAQTTQGHTVYVLKVQRGPLLKSSWNLTRRYSDFDALNNLLSVSGIELQLPPKKVFGKLEREFIAERQQGLQNYINLVLNHPILSTTLYVKRFFDPERYSFNYTESSLQDVSMIFRSEADWEIVEPLQEFGWRLRKQYFLVKSKSDAKSLSVMSWMSFGPDKTFEDKDLPALIKLFTNLKHPFIYPMSLTCISDKGSLVIYELVENGSLRDQLCKVKPKSRFLKKYGKPKSYSVVNHDKIHIYGRQILLALKFLHDRGLFHGHLHTGNILLINGTCRLLDVENCVMGVPSFLRPFFIQLRKVQSVESIDVYCFGHVIYEMAFGEPLLQCCCDSFPPNSPPELRSVLEATLTTEACRRGLPSVADLLMHPFFVKAADGNDEKVHLKVSSQLKDGFKKLKEAVENRLKEDQKVIRRTQRLTKVQVTSEEEKRKRITERRKQQKSQNAATTTPNGISTPTDYGIDTSVSDSSPISGSPLPPPPPPAPPFTPPPPPMMPPPAPPPLQSPTGANDRFALLSSIQGFSKNKLKKCDTKDASVPKL